MAETFWSWSRSQVFRLGTPQLVGGRLRGALPLTLRDMLNKEPPAGGATPFEFVGPGDVAGLDPSAITARVPMPGAWDAVQTKAVHLEFAEPDLPWRYTPRATTDDPVTMDRLPPWLVLVAGRPDEVVLGRRGTVELRTSVLAAHDLSQSHRWIHVHQQGDGRFVARLLSPLNLHSETDYVAALVPAFTVDGDGEAATLRPAWTPGTPSVSLPCFDSWRFRTGEAGDFAEIAARLKPVAVADLPADFGTAIVWLGPGPRPPAAPGSPLRAALAPVLAGPPPDEQPLDPAVLDWLSGLTAAQVGPEGRWLLTLPDYGGPWPKDPAAADAAGWRAQLARDPRRRGVAGLGAWAAMEWKERISDAAAAQAGALAAAAQRISYLTFGLAAARAVWTNRLPATMGAVARLAVLAPALARIPSGTITVAGQLDGRTPMLTAELFTTAARRVLRQGPARSSLASPGATRPEAVLVEASRCPPPEQPDPLSSELLHAHADWEAAFSRLVDDARARAGGLADAVDQLVTIWRNQPHGLPSAEMLAALAAIDGTQETLERLRRAITNYVPLAAGDIQSLTGLVRRPAEPDPCAPVDFEAVAGRVLAAVDPRVAKPLVVERVLATITGLREPLLAPPEISPELDLPLWKFLDERARDWLLPGVSQLAPDSVVGVASNPTFVDAFLLGANVQTLGELRWRNIAVTTGWTPLRRFWQRVAPAQDIRPVLGKTPPGWAEDSRLGDVNHAPLPAGIDRANLVVVFRTELFRRYPATLVYLAPPVLKPDGTVDWKKVPPVDDVPAQRIEPHLTGSIGPDVVFFGFPVPPKAGHDHWVVLEEPPPGTRFYTQAPPDTPDWTAKRDAAVTGAAYASATYAQQVRVFLGNLVP